MDRIVISLELLVYSVQGLPTPISKSIASTLQTLAEAFFLMLLEICRTNHPRQVISMLATVEELRQVLGVFNELWKAIKFLQAFTNDPIDAM